jgi:crossover junction endodeoxyribonuclease RusA
MTITEIHIEVNGRPAPQGSKKRGEHGQMREASAYLRPWRAAVKRAAYETFRTLGVTPKDLPLFVGPVEYGATYWLPDTHRIDGPPDMDKLTRATWDALSAARVWEDDARVTHVAWLEKAHPLEGEPTGANIMVRAFLADPVLMARSRRAAA